MKIEPCPVCGLAADLTDDSEGYETPTFYVSCTAGGCLLGPNRPTAIAAIATWDRLAQAVRIGLKAMNKREQEDSGE